MQPTTASTTSNGGSKKNVIAILPTGVEEVVESMASSDNNNNKGEASGGGGLFGIDLFGGKKDEPLVPTTLMNAGGSIVIRYGELFGAPESSVSVFERKILILSKHVFFFQAIISPTIACKRHYSQRRRRRPPLPHSTYRSPPCHYICTARIITLHGRSKT